MHASLYLEHFTFGEVVYKKLIATQQMADWNFIQVRRQEGRVVENPVFINPFVLKVAIGFHVIITKLKKKHHVMIIFSFPN